MGLSVEKTSGGEGKGSIIGLHDPILVTGAAGFIGSRVVRTLLERGFKRVRVLVRPSSDLKKLRNILGEQEGPSALEFITGNSLSADDARRAAQGVAVIYHLAAGTGSKSFPDAFLNSVVTTRNLLEGALLSGGLKRFVNLSSFAVYSNHKNPHWRVLDESSPIEPHPQSRVEAYCYAKVKQDEIVIEYGKKHQLPYVLVRPGVVYGPGKHSVTGRVGIDSFGFFMHLGGSNRIPFTFVENCADAIVLAGLTPGVDGEVFNVSDDNLPTSRQFLRAYKKNVRSFRSVYLPKSLSYLMCLIWEKSSAWSHGHLPGLLTRREWRATWKPTSYPNKKLKDRLGWQPRVSTDEGMKRYFASCREALTHA